MSYGTASTVFSHALFGMSAPDISALPVILLVFALSTGVKLPMVASGQPVK